MLNLRYTMAHLSKIYFLVVTFWVGLSIAHAQVNTLNITTRTMAALPDCISYEVKGFCVWQYGVLPPQFMMTPYVSHYTPDVVVSVFAQNGENPWFEARESYDKAAFASGDSITRVVTGHSMGQGSTQGKHRAYNKLKLREVDVIGNPALVSNSLPVSLPGLLKSQARSMEPYYISMVDNLLWRSSELDAHKLVSGFLPENEITNAWPLYTWGGLYPRTGYSPQNNIAKGSFKIALRGLSIATSNNLHLHQNLDARACGSKCKSAGEAKPNSKKTLWQRIYPNGENTCKKLPDGEYPSWVQGELDEGFVWIAWRYYEGCVEGQGKVIETVRW